MARKKKNNTSTAAKDKAALYIRVSTVYQIDKDSLKVQERELINYTQLVLNINDCVKNIPFYDLKHFFQDVIKEVYVDDGKITAIKFCTEDGKSIFHQFER